MNITYIRDEDAKRKLDKAIIKLVMRRPFYASIAMKLDWNEDLEIPTMMTNGREVRYSPDFVNECSSDELLHACCHESLHVVHCHHTRRGSRDPDVWNDAGDYVINALLEADGFRSIPHILLDPQYAGKSTEHVFEQLSKKRAEQSEQGEEGEGEGEGESSDDGAEPDSDQPKGAPSRDGSGCGTVCDFEPEPYRKATEAETAVEEQRVAMDLQSAIQAAQATGTLPGPLAKLVEELFEPKAPWQDLMRRFFDAVRATESDFTKPDKRTLHRGFRLPGESGEGIGAVVLACDSSGSVSDAMLNMFLSEIEIIMAEVKPDEIYVVPCDSNVHEDLVQELGWHEEIERTRWPRGGTLFQPVFEWVEKQGVHPACLVYFTDMMNADRGEVVEPNFPVLWADYASGIGFDQGFGERVIIE